MMEKMKKAIEAIEALGLYNGEELCLSLIQDVINTKVTFLDNRQQEIIGRLPTIGKWVTIHHKNQGESYLDFEKWKVVDSRVFHDFIMENHAECKRLGLGIGEAWFTFPKRLTVVSRDCDQNHHSAQTLRVFAMARLQFVEDWLAKN